MEENRNGVNLQLAGAVLWQSAKDFMHDSGPQWAAAIAYYSLLSAFPLILALAAVGSYFMSQEEIINQVTQYLNEYLPRGVQEIRGTVQEALRARQSIGLVSFLVYLWSGSRVFGVLTKALNIAFDVDETYSFLKRLLIELIMVLTVGLLFLIAITLPSIPSLIGGQVGFIGPQPGPVVNIGVELISFGLLLLSFYLVYRYVPRREVDWRAALPGALLAVLLFVLARPLFTYYTNSFANFDIIYGTVVAYVVIAVVWAWISAIILLYSGEVAAHIQTMVLEKQPAEEVERRHKERAPTTPAEA